MLSIGNLVERIADALDRVTVVVASILTAAMTLALVLQVVFRFVVRSPLSWSEEFARYCFVWLASLGAAAGVRRGLHPGIDLLPARWSARTRELVAAAGAVASAAFLVVLAVYGWRLAEFNMRQRSPAMGLPMGVPYGAIPVSAAIMLVHLLAKWARPGREEENEKP